MSGIIRKSDAPVAVGSGVTTELIRALEWEIAQRWVATGATTMRGVSERAHQAAADSFYCSRDGLEAALADGEAVLAGQQFRWLSVGLDTACSRASHEDIAKEIAVLLMAFPGRDDLSAFVQLAVEEIAGERPSRLTIAAACRRLRRTAKFRPSISEMLEAHSEVSAEFSLVVGPIRALPARVEALRERLARSDFVEMIAGPRVQRDK